MHQSWDAVDGSPVLTIDGSIEGQDLAVFGQSLDRLCRRPVPTVMLDVSRVDEWSLLAQAMVLSSARRMTARGGQLVLCGPSVRLHAQSAALRVFDRVTTVRSPGAHAYH